MLTLSASTSIQSSLNIACTSLCLSVFADDTADRIVPTRVQAFGAIKVVQISCGSGDAHTLALDENGKVWSWGDGDYGKLGRGGSDISKVPQQVTQWGTYTRIVKVACGAQFSMALAASGHVFTW